MGVLNTPAKKPNEGGAPPSISHAPKTAPREAGGPNPEKLRTEQATLEANIAELRKKQTKLKEKFKQPDRNDDFPYGATFNTITKPFAQKKINDAIQQPQTRGYLQTLGLVDEQGNLNPLSANALLALTAGLNQRTDDLEKLWEQEYQPSIESIIESLNNITVEQKIPPGKIFADFNNLTGMEIFAVGRPVLNAGSRERPGFIAYMTTRSGGEIQEDLRNLAEYSRLSAELRQKDERALLISRELTKGEGKGEIDIGQELSRHPILIEQTFRKAEAATYTIKAIPPDSELGNQIIKYLEAKINELDASAEDLLTIKPNGEIKKTPKAEIQARARDLQAQREYGQGAPQESNWLSSIGEWLSKSALGKMIYELIQKIVGLFSSLGGSSSGGQESVKTEPTAEALAQEPEEASSDSEAEPSDFEKEQTSFFKELTTRKIEVPALKNPENKELLEKIIAQKKGPDGRPDWKEYFDAYLEDPEIAELQKSDIAAERIEQIFTSKKAEKKE